MRVLRYWRLGLGAAFALCVSLAFAADPAPYPECDHKPTPSDLDGAKGAHKAAAQFYDRGDYDKAIRYWLDAYTFDCTAHGVLPNISNAYEKKGDKQAAIVALETYLKRSGPDPVIAAKINNLKQSLLPSSTDAGPPPSATASVSAPLASASVVPTVVPPPTSPRPFGAAPWVVVGGGAAVTLLGAILLPTGLNQISEAGSHCNAQHMCTPANSKYIDIGNAGRIQEGVGIAALSLGGAAMVGGLVWQFAFNKPTAAPAAAPKPAAVKVSPVVGPGQAGISVKGAF